MATLFEILKKELNLIEMQTPDPNAVYHHGQGGPGGDYEFAIVTNPDGSYTFKLYNDLGKGFEIKGNDLNQMANDLKAKISQRWPSLAKNPEELNYIVKTLIKNKWKNDPSQKDLDISGNILNPNKID